jgi:Superfamily I DNA and RNA helicases
MPVRYIKAVPGAGKTKNLIDETYRLMNSDGIDKVAAITFTDRASKELRERIKKKAIEDKNETIIKNLHQANIGTIHNFCARIIRDYGFLINLIPEFQIIEEGESNLLILRRIRSFVLNRMTEDSRIGRELRRIIDLFDFDVDELIYILNSFVNETISIF